jgi:hypothetical protein
MQRLSRASVISSLLLAALFSLPQQAQAVQCFVGIYPTQLRPNQPNPTIWCRENWTVANTWTVFQIQMTSQIREFDQYGTLFETRNTNINTTAGQAGSHGHVVVAVPQPSWYYVTSETAWYQVILVGWEPSVEVYEYQDSATSFLSQT